MPDAAALDPLPAVLARLAALGPRRAADAARADQDARWRAGDRVPAEAYLGGLPAVAADPEQALVLVYGEVLSRAAGGEAPGLAVYQARFPALADRLVTQFAVHDALAAAAAAHPRRGGADPTVGQLDSEPGDFSADVQRTVSSLGPPAAGGPAEVGRLAHYRVLRLLGERGMGMVFLAEDTRLDRPVALKVMRPSLARGPAAHGRFLREAKAAAAVRHDHVVTIYQVDEHDGTPFLAMELLDGLPLDAWLKAHPSPPLREVVRIAREAADGLAAAHARGLIHRDVKPANLWVEAPSGRVKILDFGLARPAADDTQASGDGAVVGTPAYMAPEQARGRPVDHRADLFSLGVVLYRMVTGRPPFAGASVMEVLTALAVDTPAPVSALNPAAPPALAGLIDRLLAKDPAGRPGSAAEVARALRLVEAGLELVELPRAVPVEVPGENPWREIELTEADPSVPEAAPVADDDPPAPPPPVRARRRSRPVRWAGLAIWGVLAVLTVGGAVALYRHLRTEGQAITQAPPADPVRTEPKPAPPKKVPEPLPPVAVPPLDDGPSPLDALDPAKIPAGERFDWQPKELVAVIGTHKMHHWGNVGRIVYSPKGDLVASAGVDGVRIWNAATMAEKATLPPQYTYPSFAPDGKSLLVSDWVAGKAVLFDVTADPPKIVATIPAAVLGGYPFSPDGTRVVLAHGLLAADTTATAGVWELSGAAPWELLRFPLGMPSSVLAMPAPDRVLNLQPHGEARSVELWQIEGVTARKTDGRPLDMPEFAVSPDGRWFASSSTNKKVRVYDISGGTFEEKGTFEDAMIGERAVALQFVAGTSELYFGTYSIKGLRDIAAGRTRPVPIAGSPSLPIAIAPGGTRLVDLTGQGSPRLAAYDLKADGTIAMRHEADSVHTVLPAPAANRVMTWENPHPTRRGDLDGPEPKPLAIKQASITRGLSALPDGRVVGRDGAGVCMSLRPLEGRRRQAGRTAPDRPGSVRRWSLTIRPVSGRRRHR